MKGIISTVLVVVCFSLVSSQRLSFGQCQNVEVQQDFSVGKFTGFWYEIEKYPVSFELGLKCVTANYTEESDHINVVNTGIIRWLNAKASTEAELTTPNAKEPAKMKLTYKYFPFPAPFWVLDTNYNEYSVIYSCVDMILLKAEYLWILSRKSKLDETAKKGIYEKLKEKKINTTLLRPTEQDC